MHTNTNGSDAIDWEGILVSLTAFALSWAKGRSWFRGKDTTTFLAGKQPGDYALQAIGKYLENPHKFNAEKGTLLEYLKYSLVRGFIANDSRKSENILTDDIFSWDEDQSDDDGSDTSSYSERIMPHTAASFPDDIDYAAVRAYIEKEIEGDEGAEKILLGVYTNGMKRREIIKEYGMTEDDYGNAMRRLNTVLNRAGKFFNEKRPSI